MNNADDFLKWKSEQALRQAEARLVAQHAALSALEARATSAIGWATTIAIAATAAAVANAPNGANRWFSLALATSMALAAICAAMVLFPRAGWGMPGHQPKDVLNAHGNDPTEAGKWLAEGYDAVIETNRERLKDAGDWLRYALGLMLIGAGTSIVAAAALLIRSAASAA